MAMAMAFDPSAEPSPVGPLLLLSLVSALVLLRSQEELSSLVPSPSLIFVIVFPLLLVLAINFLYQPSSYPPPRYYSQENDRSSSDSSCFGWGLFWLFIVLLLFFPWSRD